MLGVRGDGRSNLDFRHFVLETGILTHTNGSARLKISGTDVLVGVKLETGEPNIETPKEGRLHFSVEISPSASPEIEGRLAEGLNEELTGVLQR